MSEEEEEEEEDPTLVTIICGVDMISFTPSERETFELVRITLKHCI
jgi:hypothetical protein